MSAAAVSVIPKLALVEVPMRQRQLYGSQRLSLKLDRLERDSSNMMSGTDISTLS
jgi:hypothetical protein